VCSNHDKAGKVLYVKFTVDGFNKMFETPQDVKDGDIFDIYEFNKRFKGMYTCVPVHIDNSTQGIYEVVCEAGIGIWQ
jgi:hypothetical protein